MSSKWAIRCRVDLERAITGTSFCSSCKFVNGNHIQVLSGLTDGEKRIDPARIHLKK